MAPVRKLPLIDADRCSGCGRCIAVCPLPLIAFETHAWRKTAVLQNAGPCTGCSQCAFHCPVGAIQMTAPPYPATSTNASAAQTAATCAAMH